MLESQKGDSSAVVVERGGAPEAANRSVNSAQVATATQICPLNDAAKTVTHQHMSQAQLVKLDNVECELFHPKGATVQLLIELMQRQRANGESALSGLLTKVSDYHERFADRVSLEQMEGRFDAFVDCAQKILRGNKQVESVFFFGGALRGRENAKDVDVCCMLRPGLDKRNFPLFLTREIVLLPVSYVLSELGFDFERVPRTERSLKKRIKKIAGLPADFTVKEDFEFGYRRDYNDPLPPGAKFLLNSGPLLLISRAKGSLAACFFHGNQQFESGEVFKQKGFFSRPTPIKI